MSNANRRESSTGKAMNDKRKRQGREKDKVIIPAASSLLDMPQSYTELLADIKNKSTIPALKRFWLPMLH
jgi:hypothetical protein